MLLKGNQVSNFRRVVKMDKNSHIGVQERKSTISVEVKVDADM